jgi:hypothetical protein
MELEYTITISGDEITLTFTEPLLDLEHGYITNTRSNTDVSFAYDSTELTITFVATVDAEYFIVIPEFDLVTIHSSYLLVNKDSLSAANLLNKKDVNKIIKMSSVYTSSKVLDCLNRVAIAQHRIANNEEDYIKINDTLALIEVVADNNCEEC